MVETFNAPQSVHFVMVGTTHPGNIGAAARVMTNMGLSSLRLVRPRRFPDPEAIARAAGAERLLETAQVFDDLRSAVQDCSFVIGATARQRAIEWPLFDSGSAAARLVLESGRGASAVVFGPEASGLSNAELDLCHAHLRIDVNEHFPSLNVATAMAIVAYEIRQQVALSTSNQVSEQIPTPATVTMGEFDGLMDHVEQVMEETGFFLGPRTKLVRKLRRMLLYGVKSGEDVNIMRGVLTAIQQKLRASRS